MALQRMSKKRRCSPVNFDFALVSASLFRSGLEMVSHTGVKPAFWFRFSMKPPRQPFVAVLQRLAWRWAPTTLLHRRDDHVGCGVEKVAASAARVVTSRAVTDRSDETVKRSGHGIAVFHELAHHSGIAVALARHGARQHVVMTAAICTPGGTILLVSATSASASAFLVPKFGIL
jgi:hypothetical protein